MQRGTERSDASYLSQEKAPRDNPRSAQLVRVLSPEAFFAYLLSNHAVSLRAAGKAREAARHYDRALELHPWDEEARRNRDATGPRRSVPRSRPTPFP